MSELSESEGLKPQDETTRGGGTDHVTASPSTSTGNAEEGNKPFQPLNFKYPVKIISGPNRSFKPDWYKQCPWLNWQCESETAIKLNLKVTPKNVKEMNRILKVGFQIGIKLSKSLTNMKKAMFTRLLLEL